jgi:hypothetical protein
MVRRTGAVVLLVGLVAATAALTASGAGAPVPGKPCKKAGATTGGGPGVTLVCKRRKGKLVWTKATSGEQAQCGGLGTRPVTPARASAKGAFTHAYTEAAKLRLITNGRETNDPRFVYNWIATPGAAIQIFAPADGVLFKIRHKTRNAVFASDDYDLFFLVDCKTIYRFNHITAPRGDLKAAYPAGALPSGDYEHGGPDVPERTVPTENIRVKAGDALGSTTGTPEAHNWDFEVAVDDYAVCPFGVFEEPWKTTFMNLLGPQNGAPTPGYACSIAHERA